MDLQARKHFESRLSGYFHQRLTRAVAGENPPPTDDALWYLGRMLAHFGLSRHLFSYEDGQLSLRPLALLYQDARHADSEWERCITLRKLGDTALFVGALFPESYSKRGLSQHYFEGMGRSAYDYLGENHPSNPSLFQAMASGFRQMLRLVALACEKEQLYDATDLLRVYERWQATGDQQLADQLTRAGWVLAQGRA